MSEQGRQWTCEGFLDIMSIFRLFSCEGNHKKLKRLNARQIKIDVFMKEHLLETNGVVLPINIFYRLA